MPHVWSMQEAEKSWQLEHYRTKSTVWPDSYLATQTCNSSHLWDWVARMPCFAKKCIFTFLTYPTINTLIPTKCKEFSRENFLRDPRENQDWLIHNLRHLILQISPLSLSPLTYPWKVYLPNPYLTIPISMRRYFGAWEAIRRWLIHMVDAMGLLRDPEN